MGKKTRRAAKSAEEADAYGRWRHVLCYLDRPGAVKKIKRRTHRRERREGKAEARGEW